MIVAVFLFGEDYYITDSGLIFSRLRLFQQCRFTQNNVDHEGDAGRDRHVGDVEHGPVEKRDVDDGLQQRPVN